MLSKRRLWAMGITATLLVAVLSALSSASQRLDPVANTLLSVSMSVLASGIFSLLIFAEVSDRAQASLGLAASREADFEEPNGLETGVYVAGVSLSALLFTATFSSSLLTGIDRIEHAGQLSFTAEGYVTFQLYMTGALFMATWMPLATLFALWAGTAGGREIRLPLFLGGAAAGVAIYLPGGLLMRLIKALAGIMQLVVTLGAVPFSTNLSAGPTWLTAFAAQVAALIVLILLFALYPWTIAHVARFAAITYQRLRRT